MGSGSGNVLKWSCECRHVQSSPWYLLCPLFWHAWLLGCGAAICCCWMSCRIPWCSIMAH